MAVTVSAFVIQRDTVSGFEITATLDADTTTGAVPHGLASLPLIFWQMGLQAAARISLWTVTAIDATNVTITKATTAGSGAAGVQVRFVFALLPAFCAGIARDGTRNPFALTI